jgi:hypothetical protein
MARTSEPPVQRGFRRLGVVIGVLVFVAATGFGWAIAKNSGSTFYASFHRQEQLDGLKIIECPKGFEPGSVCVLYEKGKFFQTYHNISNAAALERRRQEIEAEYAVNLKAASESFVEAMIWAAVVSLVLGGLTYVLFTAIGWALAGFSKRAPS